MGKESLIPESVVLGGSQLNPCEVAMDGVRE